jgi:hypothetical protein
MAKQVSGRLRAFRFLRARQGESDEAQRDPLAAYAAPPRRSKEPPYASLRQ